MKKGRNLVLGMLLLICHGCSSPKALEYVTYRNFTIRSLGFKTSSVGMDLEYYNSNNFGLQLKNSDLDIFIDGVIFGHSTSDSLISIPRRDTFLLPIRFDVDMQNLYKNAFNTLRGKEVTLKLSGKLKVGKGNVFMSLPLDYETKETFSLF